MLRRTIGGKLGLTCSTLGTRKYLDVNSRDVARKVYENRPHDFHVLSI